MHRIFHFYSTCLSLTTSLETKTKMLYLMLSFTRIIKLTWKSFSCHFEAISSHLIEMCVHIENS